MNTYQSKFESIKARRLNMQQRVNAFLKSAAWILAAFYLIPVVLIAAWVKLGSGYGLNIVKYDWLFPLLVVLTALANLALIGLLVYALVQAKKLLVRSLSGIMES